MATPPHVGANDDENLAGVPITKSPWSLRRTGSPQLGLPSPNLWLAGPGPLAPAAERSAPSRRRPSKEDKKAHKKAMVQQKLSECTKADPSFFMGPRVERLHTSGGTAVFYALRLQVAAAARFGSPSYFIGKDLSHAMDEVDFYEEVLTNITQDSKGPLTPLLQFMFEYAGVISVEDVENGATVDLLVMRNLRDLGTSQFRMLDVKIGQKTAAPNWKGKSQYRALRQDMIDQLTNSQEEGFRLEGVDGKAPALQSMEKICAGSASEGGKKTNFKFLLQQMHCCDVLMHFLDVHQTDMDPELDSDHFLTPTEVAEGVLLEVCCQLTLLSLACRKAPAPQKWVGSSVALCFDPGQSPKRSVKTHGDIAKIANVQVRIFDWGRSELNTPKKHSQLSQAQRTDYEKFWGYYIDGIDRLGWEAVRSYRHRFGNHHGWKEVLVTLVDFDELGAEQVMGQVRIAPLMPTAEQTVSINDLRGHPLKSRRIFGKVATLTYSIAYRTFPVGSRLHGVWRVGVLRATNLPHGFKGLPDVFAEVVASSERKADSNSMEGEVFGFRQVTSVVPASVHPEWCETLELPVASQPGLLESVLRDCCTWVAEEPLAPILPCDEVVLQAKHEAKQLLLPHTAEQKRATSTEVHTGVNGESYIGSSTSSFSRASVITLGQDLDDQASIEEWQDRLDRACMTRARSSTMSSQRRSERMEHTSSHFGASTGVHPRRRVGRAEGLRMVQQTPARVRIMAMLGMLCSMGASCWLLFVLVYYEWLRRIESPANFIIANVALAQLVFGPTACLFETRRRQVAFCCMEHCRDSLSQRFMFHRLGHRGLFYILSGGLWLIDFFFLHKWFFKEAWHEHRSYILGILMIAFIGFVGLLLCGVGVMLLSVRCGLIAATRGVVRRTGRIKDSAPESVPVAHGGQRSALPTTSTAACTPRTPLTDASHEDGVNRTPTPSDASTTTQSVRVELQSY